MVFYGKFARLYQLSIKVDLQYFCTFLMITIVAAGILLCELFLYEGAGVKVAEIFAIKCF